MAAVVLFMIVILGLVTAVGALVLMGIEGRGQRRAPQLADRLARAARHLNGDAETPAQSQSSAPARDRPPRPEEPLSRLQSGTTSGGRTDRAAVRH